MALTTSSRAPTGVVVVVGTEGAGKSSLAAALTGAAPRSANFRGSTVECETFAGTERILVDTPGIVRHSDSETTREALKALERHDLVLLVLQATRVDEDLADMLPLVAGKRGAVAVSFFDKIRDMPGARGAIERISRATGVPFVPMDARAPTAEHSLALRSALASPRRFATEPVEQSAGWHIEPRATLLEARWAGPAAGLALLVLPALIAVWGANGFAGWLNPLVSRSLGPIAHAAAHLASPMSNLLAGRYGVLTMGPLLLVWALPTVTIYSLLLASYKASGLADRLSAAVHPLLRPLGLSGRDLVRILMGFGCNVPAVISTRACSRCTRDTCIQAISFGSACSYQLGATLAVFAAAGAPGLVFPFLAYLVLTTLIYTRLVSNPIARDPTNQLMVAGRAFLEWPRPADVWREASYTLRRFLVKALPIFFAITIAASLVDWLGLLDMMAGVLAPVMGCFRLPADAALVLILASVRKDGLLLFAGPALISELNGVQLLTGVYLAGVLLPCAVTALTMNRERSLGFTLKLAARQAAATIVFSLALAWGAWLLFG